MNTTRRKCDFHIPSCNATLFKRNVINMGIRLYNRMPTRMKRLEVLGIFKQKFKLFLLDHHYLLNGVFYI